MTFIGDRFVSVGHQWLDIVSGRHVSLRVGAPPASIETRERDCRRRWMTVGSGPRLVDFGRQGATAWFEATAAAQLIPPAPMRQLLWPQVADLATAIAAGSAPPVVSVFAPPGAGFQWMCEQLAQRVRDAGFVTVRVDVPIPYQMRRRLLHRHLVLIAGNEAAKAHARGWLAQLALISDRRHVLIERVPDDCAELPAPPTLSLRPFEPGALMDAAGGGDALQADSRGGVRPGLPMDPRIVDAATRSGGWPAKFVRDWAQSAQAAPVARERAVAYAAPPLIVHRELARADTCGRRRRPMAESEWHAAAAAAARRHGDEDAALRATARWVERLVDEGKHAKAIDVARLAMARESDATAKAALTCLCAQAHLAAAQMTRAETMLNAAFATQQMLGAAPTPAMRSARWELMFWTGRWQDLRAALESADEAERTRWVAMLDWADRGPGESVDADGTRFDCAPLRGERGLAFAINVAIRRTLGTANPSELAWLDDVIRREGLRGLARFSQGMTQMQMLRDMSALMEIVQSCEDDAEGLARIVEWITRAAGATAAAFLAVDGDAIAGECTRRAAHGDGTCAVATADVRFAGAIVATLVASGAPDAERALQTAVQAAAAVCGSLVRSRLDTLASARQGEALAGEILGTSPAIRSVRAVIARVALAPFSVVIEGESGTGKELVARALHRRSARRDRTFAALNCAALTDELIEAELFGHARGAFTHAVNARTGLFEEAHRGTLFLDEVGELSPRAQAKLLRALQEGEIRRVGENDARAVDVRVIAATNRPLATLAAEGKFREDLLFRLAVVKIAVPPLRERAEDIPQLALEFWRASAKRVDTRALLGPDAIAMLTQMTWPGNVRQLQNAMAALAVAAPKTGRVGARLVRLVLDGLVDTSADVIVPLDEARRQLERRLVSAALARHTGNRADAARALGLSRQGLAKALRRLGLAEAGAA